MRHDSTMPAEALEVALACKGFLDLDEGQRLFELARDHAHLGPIVEIGSYCGKSSVYLGSGARAGGGRLICVDHHRGNEENQRGELYHDPEVYDASAGKLETLPYLRQTLRKAALEDVAVLMITTSAVAAELLQIPPGMVFIDGGHTQAAADIDYESWAPKVAAGGILAIHDLFPDPNDGGQAPITIYRRAVASGDFDELPTTKTLGVLRKRG
jgi:predicted O-methyltransferase YrrM